MTHSLRLSPLGLPLLLIGLLAEEALAPREAAAQDLGTRCELRTYALIDSREPFPGQRITRLSRPFLVCPDGLQIRADSAVIHEFTGLNELIGRVRFVTPERELEAVRADYYEREGRLFARGSVVFRDRVEGTVVRGDTLNYLEANERRDEEQITVWGGRPEAEIRSAPVAGEPEAVPYLVRANRLRFQGERFFWGDGDVEVEREGLDARADSLTFNQEDDELVLRVDARVVREGTVILGDQVTVRFFEERIREIVARGDAGGRSEGFDVSGDEMVIRMDDQEEVESLTARGREDEEGRRERAVIRSEEVHLQGMEIVIDPEADDGIRVIRASRAARAESLQEREGRLPDTLDDDDLEPLRALGIRLDRDWIQGDEVVVTLVRRSSAADLGPPAAPDADEPSAVDPVIAEGEDEEPYIVRELEAVGNAASFYRSVSDDDEEESVEGRPEETEETDRERESDPEAEPSRSWSLSYVLADRIHVRFAEGEVHEILTEGNVRGILLDPREERGAAAGGTSRPARGENAGR